MEIQINRSENELTHWGVKGQKWGVRRYQNPDGSLTEEGKKHYMTAAKKGMINPRKLSDNDLNMINSRFAREKQYAQNISEYEKSKFSYKLKEAAISRIKGKGGKGGKGGGTGLGKMLAMPIKKAFEDAIKFDPGKGGGKNGGDLAKSGKRFCDNLVIDMKTGEKRTRGSRRAEDIVRGRNKTSHPKPTPKSKPVVSVAAKKVNEWDSLAARAAKSGLIISHKDTTNYVVRRSKPSESLTI